MKEETTMKCLMVLISVLVQFTLSINVAFVICYGLGIQPQLKYAFMLYLLKLYMDFKISWKIGDKE